MDFTVRLRKAVEFCNYDQLKTCTDPTEEMVLVALVAGLRSSYQQEQVLRQMQLSEMNVSQVHEFAQQLEDVKALLMKPQTPQHRLPPLWK